MKRALSEVVTDIHQNRKNGLFEYKLPEGENSKSSGPIDVSSFSHIRDLLKVSLNRQIGPVGEKVLSKVIEKKWRASSPPSREEILELINLLKNEIDDINDRNEFIKEARKIIS
ncbi:MAG: hypothetical protein NT055_03330 [Nitrospirae bacterium]|nr:hypothetical protein [Nitrospirota bacterium]